MTVAARCRRGGLTWETVTRGTTTSLKAAVWVVVYVLASDLGLALWRVLWEFAGTWTALPDVFVTSLEAVTASLLPVPPPLPDMGTWRAVLSWFCLVTLKEDRCLMLCLDGRLGRWSCETLLMLPCEGRLVLPAACCWGRWLDAEERQTALEQLLSRRARV